jgi:predicted ATP-grasp superfamily ATP-dependent carboligase
MLRSSMSPGSSQAPFIAAVGLSARMLAQSARRAGLNVAALDIFGDRDTRRYAPLWLDIGGEGLSIDRTKLFDALERTARLPRMLGFVVTSGLEPLAQELCGASRLPRFIGNSAQATAAVREPRQFFALLDRLGVAHPEVAFTRPVEPAGWLLKRTNGCGGTHIEVLAASRSMTPADAYFQRLSNGRSLSALFIGARGRASVIGFAEQFSVAAGRSPYLHIGSAGPVDLPSQVVADVTETINAIVAHTDLTGLNSIDFLLDDRHAHVLEINARPSSTMTLYETASPHEWPRGLIGCHIDACLHGRLPATLAIPATPTFAHLKAGQRTVFSPRDFVVSARFSNACFCDPQCHDIPQPGVRIGAGEPVCTLVVTQACAAAVEDELGRREAVVLQRIETCQEDADAVIPAAF